MLTLLSLALSALPLAVIASPTPQAPGGGPGVPRDLFSLYGYGEGLGGYPVIYYNGGSDICAEKRFLDC
jgi:hypothetical protein